MGTPIGARRTACSAVLVVFDVAGELLLATQLGSRYRVVEMSLTGAKTAVRPACRLALPGWESEAVFMTSPQVTSRICR